MVRVCERFFATFDMIDSNIHELYYYKELLLLDDLAMRNRTYKLQFAVFRKDAYTQEYIPINSHHKSSLKLIPHVLDQRS